MNIRLELPQEYEVVERLTYEAFCRMQKPGRGECDEHYLVHKMRKVPSFLPELSYVAECDGCLAGYIAYTKSKVVGKNGAEHETLTFGPLSVLPAYQKKGIGGALIRHTLEKAKALGFKAVLITGHAEYYPRFGFAYAGEFDITMADGSNMDAFMALPLFDGALDNISGRWVYDPVFEIDRGELAQFNEEFGYANKGDSFE